MTRWIIAFFAIALLVLGGYRGYLWWAEDVEQQRAALESAPEADASLQPQPSDLALSQLGSGAGAGTAPGAAPAPIPARSGDPLAPAVIGGQINKCLINGQVTYTNEPCPEGTSADMAESTGTDPNGVTGSTGARAPMVAIRPVLPANDSPGQRAAECRFLAAEVSRLDYEFQQTLPPPVLDQIATDLRGLREHRAGLKCPGASKEDEASGN